MQRHAVFLGLCGLIPFLFLPVAIESNALALFEGVSYFSQYSAIILSFLGGVLWFDGLTNNKPASQLYIAMLPSIIAWISVAFLPPLWCVMVLGIAFIALLSYEHKVVESIEWYTNLRKLLTSVVMGCHLIVIWQLM